MVLIGRLAEPVAATLGGDPCAVSAVWLAAHVRDGPPAVARARGQDLLPVQHVEQAHLLHHSRRHRLLILRRAGQTHHHQSPALSSSHPPEAAVCLFLLHVGEQGLGEFTDVAWAPTQAVLMAAMYSESSPYAAYVGMLEEILPFTDIIPSVTLAWYPARTSPSESCCFVALLTRAPAMGCCLCQQATGERWRGGEEPSSHGAADAAVPAAAAVPALPAPGAAPGAAAPGRPDPMSRQAGRRRAAPTQAGRGREARRGEARGRERRMAM